MVRRLDARSKPGTAKPNLEDCRRCGFRLVESAAGRYVTLQVTSKAPPLSAAPAIKLEPSKPVLLSVGRDYLRRVMHERDRTITALAAEVGVSRKHLSNVLSGRAPLAEPLLGQLCRALMIEPSFLVCLLDDGVRLKPGQSSYGCMKGTIEILGDLTEPMADWEMLED